MNLKYGAYVFVFLDNNNNIIIIIIIILHCTN